MADKIQMPQSGGGLVRYYDEYSTKFEIKAAHVIAFIILVIFLEILLHNIGKGWLG